MTMPELLRTYDTATKNPDAWLPPEVVGELKEECTMGEVNMRDALESWLDAVAKLYFCLGYAAGRRNDGTTT